MSAHRYLISEEAAERLRISLRSLHELTRTGRIPHRRLPGKRRCLFIEHELDLWVEHPEAPLELIESAGGVRLDIDALEVA